MTTIPCTVGILTKNSGGTLRRTLENVKDFGEILMCDGDSTDDTLKIASEFKARVMSQDKAYLDGDGMIQDFSAARNQILRAAAHDWFFYIDSDEYASPELVESIRRVVNERSDGAFFVSRRYIFRGKEVTCATTYPNRSMRFFSRRSVVGFRKIVHERVDLLQGVVAGDISGSLYVPYSDDQSAARKRNDRYIALEVKRKGRVGFFKFLGYAWREARVSLLYMFRLIRNLLFCRGVRLPISIEMGRHWYTLKLLRATWRARKYSYPNRVFFFINKWKTGGAEHVFLQEYNALKAEGVLVRFGVAYGEALPPGIEKKEGIFPQFHTTFDIPAYVRFLSEINDAGITHVISTLEHANIIARIAATFAPHIKVIILESGMADRKPWAYKFFDLVLNMRSDAVVSGSTGVQKSLLSYQAMHKHKIVVLLNGVSVPATRPKRIEPEEFTLFAVGSLRNEKGFNVLLDAFAQFLKKTHARAKLLIAGTGILEQDLKTQAKLLGIDAKVEFLGQLSHEEIVSRYRRVSCFVLSSVSEGNPTVVMEALAQGTPVISTRVSGVTDYIEHGVSGLLVPAHSASALQGAMQRLYFDPALRDSMGRKGYERAKERLSFDTHIRGLKKILGI